MVTTCHVYCVGKQAQRASLISRPNWRSRRTGNKTTTCIVHSATCIVHNMHRTFSNMHVLEVQVSSKSYLYHSLRGLRNSLGWLVDNSTITAILQSLPQVNTNGVLSFNQPFQVRNPQIFPFGSLALISPYWEDFETSRFGAVYYRNTTNPTLLRRAQYFLQDIFPSARNFFPSNLFLATWDNVPERGIVSGGQSTPVSLPLL